MVLRLVGGAGLHPLCHDEAYFGQIVNASRGCDIPPFQNLRDFDVWNTEGPPKGVNYNYRRAAMSFPS
jgi:hypothetical protein